MRFIKFNAVGGLGIAVQLGTIWILTSVAHLPIELATALGVTAAIVNNFIWHHHWTWRDRRGGSAQALAAFQRFVLANGLISLVGNIVVMSAVAKLTTLPPVPANLIAIAICGVVNYFVGDRLVFPGLLSAQSRSARTGSRRAAWIAGASDASIAITSRTTAEVASVVGSLGERS